jgi:hypothetical protein
MAKSATVREQEQRERDKLAEEERLARLLSRTIKVDLFKTTDAKLIRSMERMGIEEPQDLISRLIHGADRLDDETLREITDV